MRQYQTVVLKLSGRTRDDEETLTDLLNERARTGWQLQQVTAQGSTRVLVVFWRDT